MPVVRAQQKFEIGEFVYQCQQLSGTTGIVMLHRILKLLSNAGEAIGPIFADKEKRKQIFESFENTITLNGDILKEHSDSLKVMELAGTKESMENLLPILAGLVGEETADLIIEAHLKAMDQGDMENDETFHLIPLISEALTTLLTQVDEDFLKQFLKELCEQSIQQVTDPDGNPEDFVNAKGSKFETHFNASRFDVLFELTGRLLLWNFKEPIKRLKNQGAGGAIISMIAENFESMTMAKNG